MDAMTTIRGRGLIEGGRRFARGTGLFARAMAPGLEKVLARIDRALVSGTIHGTLPTGSRVTLGGRAPGFECDVELHSWNGLLRLATNGSVGWYQVTLKVGFCLDDD